MEVDHTVLSMLFAVPCRLATLDSKRSDPLARDMSATLADDLDHTILRMLLAVGRGLAPLDAVGRPRCAQSVQTSSHRWPEWGQRNARQGTKKTKRVV